MPGPSTSQSPEPQVYVVDDDRDLCDSVALLLETIGITPEICLSADDFLARYDGEHPACIILDVRMPQMSGTRLQQRLNEIAPHVGIIFVSAHGDIRLSVTTLRAGALDFLEKPYDPQQLLDAVESGVNAAVDRFANFRQKREIEENLAILTPREREILSLVVEGFPSQQIATRLGMSVKTVDVHRTRIKTKSRADSLPTLVRDILRFDVAVDQ
ncbi:response regulator [Gordonia hongkongensis]|uniref:Response regulator n=1 Tax=Gordonia hongkongensis TaxID=1701090 RepID=A0AAX3T7R2_9ACTN|nr:MULTISPECIES: response regulator [Gordonia]OCW84961.1 DNA-binding response regulator [Nocardia farcinica]QIK45817.1 response regulator transcription factor [Gordonia terrae]KSU59161.1 LuxR family transcriptional regulator [Gordonia sp. SGD-V-85]MBN0971090.1 response regulator transcription factor [Gordonia sp. BP-119]MBN0982330.1 response regulator transcription factor [Gordonia sp. BP-94]